MGSVTIELYRDLKVWQLAIEFTLSVYRFSNGFPRDEIFGLRSQLRRSAVSVAANIAEGYRRNETGSYIRFLRSARGSLKECETHLILSGRLEFMPRDGVASLLDQAATIGKMLNSLINAWKPMARDDCLLPTASLPHCPPPHPR